MLPPGRPRRIVTALGADGLTRIAKVEEAQAVRRPGGGLPADVAAQNYPKGAPDVRVIWDCEELPAKLPADPDKGPTGGLPKKTGARISVTILPPGWEGEIFWSSRVDILWVMQGELTYETDSGDTIVVAPGDFVIQNGANKAFHNRGAVPVHMGAAMFSAELTRGKTPPMQRYHGGPEQLHWADEP